MQLEPQVQPAMQLELLVQAHLVTQPELVVLVQLEVELPGQEQAQSALAV